MENEVPFIKFKSLLSSDVPNSIVLFGNDHFLKKSAIDLIKRKLSLAFSDLNVCAFDHVDANKIVLECQTVPFIDKNRLIIVYDCDDMSKQDNNIIANYAKTPNESSILVLVAGENKPIINNFCFVNCNHLDIEFLKSWIYLEAKKNNFIISSDAASCLIDRTSSNLIRIKNELDKMSAFVGREGTVDVNLVESQVAPDIDYQIFSLSELIANGKKQEALIMVEHMLIYEKNIFVIWSTLYNYFRRVFYTKISKLSNKQIADLLSVKEYAIIKARLLADKFKAVELKNILDIIFKTEENIKTGKFNQEFAIKTGLVNILNTRG